MTLAEFCEKNGRVAALRKLGMNDLASKFEKAERYKELVVEKEGVMPFDQRPEATQKKLNEANDVLFNADKIIWKNRRKGSF